MELKQLLYRILDDIDSQIKAQNNGNILKNNEECGKIFSSENAELINGIKQAMLNMMNFRLRK